MFYKLCPQTLRLRRCNQNLLESECNEWQANLSLSTYRCLEKSHDLFMTQNYLKLEKNYIYSFTYYLILMLQ